MRCIRYANSVTLFSYYVALCNDSILLNGVCFKFEIDEGNIVLFIMCYTLPIKGKERTESKLTTIINFYITPTFSQVFIVR